MHFFASTSTTVGSTNSFFVTRKCNLLIASLARKVTIYLRVLKRAGDTKSGRRHKERAKGIEPSFSAWEAHRGVLRDLRISGKV
jgi:hypothetical protein